MTWNKKQRAVVLNLDTAMEVRPGSFPGKLLGRVSKL